jgi:hypothetical protein
MWSYETNDGEDPRLGESVVAGARRERDRGGRVRGSQARLAIDCRHEKRRRKRRRMRRVRKMEGKYWMGR